MRNLQGSDTCQVEELREIVESYLKDLKIEGMVDIEVVDTALSAACVVKPALNGKYVVRLKNKPISRNMILSICDHEIGTHLLRMINDEHQVWHGCRARFGLSDSLTTAATEEGLATINTYMSLPTKLLYLQAVRYFAACRGAKIGFVELFGELRTRMIDVETCWHMCCRIKRGMTDTSLPGACGTEQAYFKGAVQILRRIHEINFRRLYCGQVALRDINRLHFLLREDCIRLPRFLNSKDCFDTYFEHCHLMMRENQIDLVSDKVPKPMLERRVRFSTADDAKHGIRCSDMRENRTDVVTECNPVESEAQGAKQLSDCRLSELEKSSRKLETDQVPWQAEVVGACCMSSEGSVEKPQKIADGKSTSSPSRFLRRRSSVQDRVRPGNPRASVSLTSPQIDQLVDAGIDLGRLPRHLETLKLDFSMCQDLDAGRVRRLAEMIPESIRSLTVDLRFCSSLGDDGVAALASTLQPMITSLTLRNVGACKGLTNLGIRALSKALPAGLEELSLDFRYCAELTDECVWDLGGHLPVGLRTLKLDFENCYSVAEQSMDTLVKWLDPRLQRRQEGKRLTCWI